MLTVKSEREREISEQQYFQQCVKPLSLFEATEGKGILLGIYLARGLCRVASLFYISTAEFVKL